MSIIKLTPDFFENMTLTANPVRTFVSSSTEGTTGSVYIFAERSSADKDPYDPTTPFTDFVSGSSFGDDSIEEFRLFANAEARGEIIPSGSLTGSVPTDITGSLSMYMDLVNTQALSHRKQKQVEILRFEPSVRFTSDTLRKNVIKDTLFTYYRSKYPSLQWAYSNYHALNFFTSDDVPSDSVLVYPSLSTNTQNVSASKGGPQFAQWDIEQAGWHHIATGSSPNNEDKFILWDSLGQPLHVVFQGIPWGGDPLKPYSVASASSGGNPWASATASFGGVIPAGLPGAGTSVDANSQHGAWYRAVILSRAIREAHVAGYTKIDAQEPDQLSNRMTILERTGSQISLWTNYSAHSNDGITGVDPDLDVGLITSGNFYPNNTRLLKGTNQYLPASGAFSFEFYINPRHGSPDSNGEYKAGTIMHMSSTFAVSLISGSSRDINGYTDGFRIMLQLSHSAEIAPSLIEPGKSVYAKADVYNNVGSNHGDLIFMSSDNSLKKNHWHHVAVRWGSDFINNSTGSFIIDGVEDTTFLIASQSAWADDYGFQGGGTQADADALFVGNFFDGSNNTTRGSLIAEFFNSHAARNQGTTDAFNGTWPTENEYITTVSGTAVDFEPEPALYDLSHPLRAEIHEVKIFDNYRSITQIQSSSREGSDTLESGLLFYVPPFFVKETRPREILQTPFQTFKSTTDDPFNVALAFGVDGHVLNLENFTREFVRGEYPRLLNLTSSTIDFQTNEAKTCNEFLYSTGSLRKRNLTVLPCDNGKFYPGFKLLASGNISSNPTSGSLLDKYTNDFGSLDFSLVSLTNLLPTGSLMPGLFQYAARTDDEDRQEALDLSSDSSLGRGLVNPENKYPDSLGTGSIVSGIVGASPENPGVAPGSILTVYQRTRDNSSNSVVFFDISNMFYGNRIKPETFKITDKNVTGSGGAISITLRDNGEGSLYRADSATQHAKWSNIGNILYDEGLCVVKTPNIPKFGSSQFDASFQGAQNIHVMEIHVPCPKGIINSSSNPAYKKLKPSDYASDTHQEFVYVTGINFHDENMNVIARTNLSQPVVKKDDDKFMFRVKVDF